jgi:hypothetical protein
MPTKKSLLCKAGLLLLAAWTCHLPAQAQGAPEISPSLKKMLGALPIAELRDEVHQLVGGLKKTPCGGKLKGCYATSSGPLQLYFFTSGAAQQTFLLVIDKKMALPKLLHDNVQKVLGGMSLQSPIISISTTDYVLDSIKMPPGLQKVVRDSYFNVSSLEFDAGVQLAARANLGGLMKLTMEGLGVKADQLTFRAAVVMPIPTDLTGGAGAGAGLADAMSHGNTMKKAGAKALAPEAYVEFQLAPNSVVPLTTPPMILTDATFFVNNARTFGYKGNATFKGVNGKKVLLQFQTLLDPAGAMDLLNFQFRIATPPSFTMEDGANLMFAMATPDPRLVQFGGGFIRNIESYKKALLTVTQPLSVFQLRNPQPVPEYRFGDASKPFPDDPKFFNIVVLGPTAPDGPYLRAVGNAVILGQKMGSIDATAGLSGMHGKAMADISLKLGPLGKVTIEKMVAEADVDKDSQRVRLKGNFGGQSVEVTMVGAKLSIDVPANCVNPFEIKATVTLAADTNIADVFAAQGGANVDPAKIGGCVGKALEAALNKIAGEYKSLGGYSATAASAELKKIADAANAAAKQAAADAQKTYDDAKDKARDVASKSSSAANKAFNDAGNAFKKMGTKKKHKKGPDPKFAASVFDWDYYYDHAQDMVKANVDLATHWRDSGFNEGRQGSPEFKAVYYRNRYPDVQALCGNGDWSCVLQHWLDIGLDQGRQGSADFSVASYLNRYGDLQNAFGKDNYSDAMEHWLTSDGSRDGHPDSAYSGPVAGPTRVGGGGGTAWSDAGAGCRQTATIAVFNVQAGKTVQGLQFWYHETGWAPAHGQLGNNATQVFLDDGDYVDEVIYRAGSSLDSITFLTKSGKTYGPYGGTGGTEGRYYPTKGEKLGCMAGRAGSAIDQLTFSSTGPR